MGVVVQLLGVESDEDIQALSRHFLKFRQRPPQYSSIGVGPELVRLLFPVLSKSSFVRLASRYFTLFCVHVLVQFSVLLFFDGAVLYTCSFIIQF